MTLPSTTNNKNPSTIWGYDDATNKFYPLAINPTGSIGSANTEGLISMKDDAGSGIIYYGWAAPGSATSSAVWMIVKIDKSADPDITKRYADGNTNQDNVWNNRASLSYS